MAQQKSVDSHIVPKTYLKNFTQSNGKLFRLKKDNSVSPKIRNVHPSEICYKRGFYQLSNAIPFNKTITYDSNILEDRGFLYENKLAKLIAKLLRPTEQLAIEEAYELATIFVDIKMRNSFVREHSYSSENIAMSIDNILAEQNRETLLPIAEKAGVPFEQVKYFTEGMKREWLTNKDIPKELHNLSLLRNKEHPSSTRQLVYNKLAWGQWIVFRTTLNDQFITSDNPGYCKDQENRIHNTKFGGDCEFFFPLDPYHYLVIIAKGNQVKTLPTFQEVNYRYAENSWVKGVNQANWMIANKEIYGTNENSLLRVWHSFNSKLII